MQESGYVWLQLDDGCSLPATDSIYVVVLPPVVADFSLMPDSVLEGKDASAINRSLNADHYLWEWDSSNTTAVSPVFNFYDTGMHRIRLTAFNSMGCSSTSELDLYVVPKTTIYVPNIFSPGNDRVNEVFAPIGIRFSYTLTIYNRWGELLFKGENLGWDGRSNGELIPGGVYIYTITVTDSVHAKYYIKGTITVLR
jgi:gliding motility-associated-like protein